MDVTILRQFVLFYFLQGALVAESVEKARRDTPPPIPPPTPPPPSPTPAPPPRSTFPEYPCTKDTSDTSRLQCMTCGVGALDELGDAGALKCWFETCEPDDPSQAICFSEGVAPPGKIPTVRESGCTTRDACHNPPQIYEVNGFFWCGYYNVPFNVDFYCGDRVVRYDPNCPHNPDGCKCLEDGSCWAAGLGYCYFPPSPEGVPFPDCPPEQACCKYDADVCEDGTQCMCVSTKSCPDHGLAYCNPFDCDCEPHQCCCDNEGKDVGWDVWGPWSACTQTCTDGTVVTRERVRVCNSPDPSRDGRLCNGGDGRTERQVEECLDIQPCERPLLVDALYPLTQAYGGQEINGWPGWHNEAHLMGTEFVPGPTGCAGGAVQLFGNEDSYIIIKNSNYKLSYGPSFSFFVNLLHEKNYCPILEYGPPNHAHPEVYLHFHTYWSNIEGLYFNLGDGSVPNPWYGVNNIVEPFVWNQVGFTYSDDSKEFKFWVNGDVASTLNLPEGLGSNTRAQEVKFGLRRGYAALKGKLNCAAFFNHALDELEVRQLRHRCTDLECTRGCQNYTNCHCFKETCYDVGFHYCKDAANACENQCHEDHCCCCQDDYRLEEEDKCDATAADPSPCECFSDEGADLTCGERQLRYCDPEVCADVDEGCPGYRCCCPEDAETCPSWAECHCMEYRCEQEAGLMECDAAVCGDGCEHGHCCCCEEDWPVCAPDAACACEAAPCDQLPGRGYCDSDRCPLPPDVAARLGAYSCPRQHCCCSMEEA